MSLWVMATSSCLTALTQMVKPCIVTVQALLALVDDAEMAEHAKQGVFYLSGIL